MGKARAQTLVGELPFHGRISPDLESHDHGHAHQLGVASQMALF